MTRMMTAFDRDAERREPRGRGAIVQVATAHFEAQALTQFGDSTHTRRRRRRRNAAGAVVSTIRWESLRSRGLFLRIDDFKTYPSDVQPRHRASRLHSPCDPFRSGVTAPKVTSRNSAARFSPRLSSSLTMTAPPRRSITRAFSSCCDRDGTDRARKSPPAPPARFRTPSSPRNERRSGRRYRARSAMSSINGTTLASPSKPRYAVRHQLHVRFSSLMDDVLFYNSFSQNFQSIQQHLN